MNISLKLNYREAIREEFLPIIVNCGFKSDEHIFPKRKGVYIFSRQSENKKYFDVLYIQVKNGLFPDENNQFKPLNYFDLYLDVIDVVTKNRFTNLAIKLLAPTKVNSFVGGWKFESKEELKNNLKIAAEEVLSRGERILDILKINPKDENIKRIAYQGSLWEY
ncbi:MAG: hypothetical protein GXX85_00205 [Ignavibacteria bacterium]|nr:hypothetical protein [Ignavibacteria bacterium]